MRRFWDNVDKSGECWEWTGKCSNGRAHFFLDGSNRNAARVAYELTHGVIQSDEFVCHHCDNEKCVRPDHLFLGSQAVNMADARTKGRCQRKLTIEQRDEIIRLRKSGSTLRDLGKEFGVSHTNIYHIMNQAEKHGEL